MRSAKILPSCVGRRKTISRCGIKSYDWGTGHKGRGMEASAAIETAKHVLLACGIVLAAAVAAGLAAQKLKVPDVAIFLITGLALGPEALALVKIPADSA